MLLRYPRDVLLTAVRKASVPTLSTQDRVRVIVGPLFKFLRGKGILKSTADFDLRGSTLDIIRQSHPKIGEVVTYLRS